MIQNYQIYNNQLILAMIAKATNKIRRLFCLYQTINAQNGKLSKYETKNFADQVRIKVKAGDGGNGCISYFSDKRVRRGQPDGGCGGKGGDIIIQAHKSSYDLSHFRRKTIQGNDGGTGGPRGKDGKNGGKTVLRVPYGTLVFQIEEHQNQKTLQKVEKKKFLIDLGDDLNTYLIAKGGQMGKGNQNYPFMKQQLKFGKEGQKKIIYLELKTLADAGLVGFPNIGKSTFLAAVSRALPKIANYQFTTLKPSVGYVKFVDDFKMTIADIPGIIQGAHENKGLGLQFLRHVERTKVLLYMLDITSVDPLSQLKKLQKQLSLYDSNKFKNKQKIVIFNKRDCLKNSEQLFKKYSQKIKNKCFLISAKEGDNVGQVLVQIRKIVQRERQRQNKQKIEQPQKKQEANK